MTIPTSIISGILLLNLFGQTINIMTLSGLALAIGILVDESTVTIENIHQHLDMGKPKRLAVWDACKEIAFPKAADPVLYPGGIRAGVHHGWDTGFIVPAAGPGHRVQHDRLLFFGADLCACHGQLDHEGA
jgi:hypothetical protein